MLQQVSVLHSFYAWIIFHCMICYILLIHLSVYWHLSCFHLLVTVNNAAINIGMQVSFWVLVFIFLDYISLNGISCWTFSRTINFFPQCLHHLTLPSTMYKCIMAPMSLHPIDTYFPSFFCVNHPSRCKMHNCFL